MKAFKHFKQRSNHKSKHNQKAAALIARIVTKDKVQRFG